MVNTAEVVGVVAFAGLYRLAPPTDVVVERRRQEREERETEANAFDSESGDSSYSESVDDAGDDDRPR